jgi:tyrosine-protein phosphatase YwqE
VFGLFKPFKNPITTDIHSHLIPSIDDGARDLNESIKLIKELQKLGYKKLITTPHIMSDGYKNTSQTINDGLNIVKKELIKQNIEIEIEAGAEYYVDDGLKDILKHNKLMTIFDKYILFETSYYARPLNLESIVFDIFTYGYKPLLAHPERYRYIKDYKKEYYELKDLGVIFQVNINSFGGYYGKDAQKKANFLNKEGLIDYLGSDTHNIKQIQNLSKVMSSGVYRSIFRNNKILNDDL